MLEEIEATVTWFTAQLKRSVANEAVLTKFREQVRVRIFSFFRWPPPPIPLGGAIGLLGSDGWPSPMRKKHFYLLGGLCCASDVLRAGVLGVGSAVSRVSGFHVRN